MMGMDSAANGPAPQQVKAVVQVPPPPPPPLRQAAEKLAVLMPLNPPYSKTKKIVYNE